MPPVVVKKPWTKQEHIPRLQALLLWQCLSLFWFCGLITARFPLAGLSLTLIILFIDKRLWQKSKFFMAMSIFILGFVAIHLSIEPRPEYPSWALDGQKVRQVRLEGFVNNVESLPNKRLRITLSHVHNTAQGQKLTGKVIWTWDQNISEDSNTNTSQNTRPLVGQRVQVSAQLRTSEGFRNFGVSDFGFYWQSQGVFWRIWSRGNLGNPTIIDNPTFSAKLRHKAFTNLEALLFKGQENFYSFENQAKSFLSALLFGEKYYLNHLTMENMAKASLMHSLALSGQHLAVVGLCAVLIVACIYTLFPNVLLIFPRLK